MNEVTIRGRTFTEEEVISYGQKRITKFKNIFLWTAIACFVCGIIGAVGIIFSGIDNPEQKESNIQAGIFAGSIYIIAGIVLLILAFKKRNPYDEGVKHLNKHFPAPIGFDGNVVDILQNGKEIIIWRRPSAKMFVSTEELKFQIYQQGRFSKILTGADILDYQIQIDDEIIFTSKTKTKRGAGKAVVGGLLLGGAGAVAGAMAGNSKSATRASQKEIHHYTLVLTINDIAKPSFVNEIVDHRTAEEVASTLMLLQSQKEEAIEETKPVEKETKLDKFEEIKKYKDLLDNGIITQEEFDVKKKELL